MRKNCGIIIALLAFLLFLIQPVFAAEQERVTVVAEGSGSTKMEALQNAWMEAVRKAVGLFMTAKTEMIDDDLTEKIVTHSRGQVNSYKTLSESQDNGIFNVVIEANIDKDILRQTAVQGKSKRMAIDGTAVLAKNETAARKSESGQEILSTALNDLELDKILRYNAEVKKAEINGREILYVEHTLSIDPGQFRIMAKELDKTLTPVASGKQPWSLNMRWGQKIEDILKNWTFSSGDKEMDQAKFNLSGRRKNMDPFDYEQRCTDSEPVNSVCVYKNSAKMECFFFDEKVMAKIVSQLKDEYEIMFEVEDGADLSLSSSPITLEWPFKRRSDNLVYIDPGFYLRNFTVSLRYNQTLDLSPEQLLNVKEITCKYILIKK